MKKTKAQKSLLWKYRKIPLFHTVINDRKDALLVMNLLTGTFSVLDK